ncbi:9822_t:CDS:2, partial [Funneliformis geosporum]
MSFHSSASERVLPPIMTLDVSSSVSHSNNGVPAPVLPPVSCLPPIPPLLSPITPPPDFTKNSSRNLTSLHISQSQSYISPPQSERTSPHSSAHGHFHFHNDAPPSQQQYVDQQHSQPFSPTRAAGSAPSQLVMTTSHINHPSHHSNLLVRPSHHPYSHPIYHQGRSGVDPASELLAEKRRRNAGASARFRDRRKQREREMQEKCQFLERRVQELESTDNAKRIVELEKKLEDANEENKVANQKLQEFENKNQQLRSRFERELGFLTPPSSSGEYDSKEILFDDTSRLSRSSSSSSFSDRS